MMPQFASFQLKRINLLICSFIWNQKASRAKMSQIYWYVRADYSA